MFGLFNARFLFLGETVESYESNFCIAFEREHWPMVSGVLGFSVLASYFLETWLILG